MDAVAGLGTRLGERADGGVDADAGDDQVGRHDLAVRQLHAVSHDAVHAGAGPHIDAMGAVFGLVEKGDGLAGDAREHPVERLQQHDMAAEFGQHRRRLQPDIAAADHRDALHQGQFGQKPIDVGAVADRVDALETLAGKPLRLAARRVSLISGDRG